MHAHTHASYVVYNKSDKMKYLAPYQALHMIIKMMLFLEILTMTRLDMEI